jgi:hypothetical protein
MMTANDWADGNAIAHGKVFNAGAYSDDLP